jgi:hypothetical protein
MTAPIAAIVRRRKAGSGRMQARAPSDPKYANDTHSEERTLGKPLRDANVSVMLVDFFRVTFVEPHDGRRREREEGCGLRAAAGSGLPAISLKHHLPHPRHLGGIESDAKIAVQGPW